MASYDSAFTCGGNATPIVATSSWADVVVLPAKLMVGSGKYLLIVSGGVKSTHPSTGSPRQLDEPATHVRVNVGASTFNGSTSQFSRRKPAADLPPSFFNPIVDIVQPYSYMTVFTQAGTAANVAVQLKCDSNVNGWLYDCTITVVRLDGLTLNTDYLFSELTSVTSLPLNGNGGDHSLDAAFATITLPATSSDWIILASASELETSKKTTSAFCLHTQTRGVRALYKNGSDKEHTVANMYLYQGTGSTETLTVKGYSPVAPYDGTSYPKHVASRVFALKTTFLNAPPAVGQCYRSSDAAPEVPPDNTTGGFEVLGYAAYGGSTSYITNINGGAGSGQSYLSLSSFFGYYEPISTGHLRNYASSSNSFWPTGANHVMSIYGKGYEEAPAFIASAERFSDNVDSTGARFDVFCPAGSYGLVAGIRGVSLRLRTLVMHGSGQPDVGSPYMVGAARMSPTSYTSLGTGSVLPPTASGSGTFSPVPQRRTTGQPRVAVPTASGNGTFLLAARTGNGAAVTVPATSSGSGTFAIPPRTGNAVSRVSSPTVSATGTFVHAPCAAYQYTAHGRETISVAQALAQGHAYPLVQPSDDIQFLLADLFLCYEDPYDYGEAVAAYELPFRIKLLFGPGCVVNAKPAYLTAQVLHEADIIVVDAADRVVFDSTAASIYRSNTWSNRLKIHEWIHGVNVCRIVVHTKWQSVDNQPAPRNYDLYLEPDLAILDARTVRRMPKRVRSILAADETLTGEIELSGGYNMDLAVLGNLRSRNQLLTLQTGSPTQGGRAGQRLQISAEAGGGLGRAPGCEDVQLNLSTVNRIEPNAQGDFILEGDDCYWFEKTTHGLVWHNDCGPCCRCEDFVEVKLAIDDLYERWRSIADQLVAARDMYAANRTRWLNAKRCFDDDRQRLVLTSSCLGYAGIGYMFCPTNESQCVGPLEVKFAVLLNSTPSPDRTDTGGDSGSTPPVEDTELLADPQFAVDGFPSWTRLGHVRAATATEGGRVRIGTFDPVQATDLLTNSGFGDTASGGSLTGWLTFGAVSVDSVSSFDEDGNHVYDGIAIVGGNRYSQLQQTVAVDAGESYRLIISFSVISGTTRVTVASAGGVEIYTHTNTPNADPSELQATIVALDSSLTVTISTEPGAADLVIVSKVRLVAWSGTLRQTLGGLEAGAMYRLSATFWSSEGSNQLRVLNSLGATVTSLNLSDGVESYQTLEKFFTPGDSTIVVQAHSSGDSESRLRLVGMSLKKIILAAGSDTTSLSGLSQGASPSTGGSPALTAKLLPDSARKSEVGQEELLAYNLQGEFPNMSVLWDKIDSGHTAKVVFAMAPCNAIEGDSLTVTATPILNGQELPGITKTISLKFRCPDLTQLCSDS